MFIMYANITFLNFDGAHNLKSADNNFDWYKIIIKFEKIQKNVFVNYVQIIPT